MRSLMNIHAIYKMLFLLGCTFAIHACDRLSPPALTSVPGVVETIVVGTAAAAQTQTALVLPSPTETATVTLQPTATKTPTGTFTPTATVIFYIPTATSTITPTKIPTATKQFESYGAGSQCELLDVSHYNVTLSPGTSFDMRWTIKNTSDDVWKASEIDFRYSGGKVMHKKDIYDLPKSVKPDRSINLIVPMVSPNKSGTYSTIWELTFKKNTLCTLSTTVTVK